MKKMEAEFQFGSDPSVEGINALNIMTPSTDRRVWLGCILLSSAGLMTYSRPKERAVVCIIGTLKVPQKERAFLLFPLWVSRIQCDIMTFNDCKRISRPGSSFNVNIGNYTLRLSDHTRHSSS
jgi:hypothetical protein